MPRIDVEKLISEIEKRPALWDMRTPEYSDRVLKRNCWDEICNLFANEDIGEADRYKLGNLLQKKWKNIRDSYSKDIQGRKRKSGSEGCATKAPYIYTQQLQFLRDTIELKEASNSVQGTVELQPDLSDDAASSSSQITTQKTHVPKIVKKKRLNPVEERIILSLDRLDKNKSQSMENDDNRQFLLSMLPTLISLPKRLNSKCRVEMMQVLNKYEDEACSAQPNVPQAAIYQNAELKNNFEIMQSWLNQRTVVSQASQPLSPNVNPHNPYQHVLSVDSSPPHSLASYASSFSDENSA